MYTLYHNRSEKVIKVSKARKTLQYLSFTEEITRFNDCYLLCANRKPLVEKAKEIHHKWILELEEELNSIKQIKF